MKKVKEVDEIQKGRIAESLSEKQKKQLLDSRNQLKSQFDAISRPVEAALRGETKKKKHD